MPIGELAALEIGVGMSMYIQIDQYFVLEWYGVFYYKLFCGHSLLTFFKAMDSLLTFFLSPALFR